MIAKLKLFWQEAKTKVTTYIALAIAGLSQMADHAEEAVNAIPGLKIYLPTGPVIEGALHWLLTGLGLLVVYTRVRRLIHANPAA